MYARDRLEETCCKIAQLRCGSSQLILREFILAVLYAAATIAAIKFLWPIIIVDVTLRPYPWWCFIPCIFLARWHGGDLAGWFCVVVGVVFAFSYEPGGMEPDAMRILTLMFLAGSRSRSWMALSSPLFSIGSIKSSAQRAASGVKLDSLAHGAE